MAEEHGHGTSGTPTVSLKAPLRLQTPHLPRNRAPLREMAARKGEEAPPRVPAFLTWVLQHGQKLKKGVGGVYVVPQHWGTLAHSQVDRNNADEFVKKRAKASHVRSRLAILIL